MIHNFTVYKKHHLPHLLMPVIAYILGIALYDVIPILVSIVALIATCAFVAVYITTKHRTLLLLAISLLCIALGSLTTHNHLDKFNNFFATISGKKLCFDAVIQDIEETGLSLYRYKTTLKAYIGDPKTHGSAEKQYTLYWYHSKKPRYILGNTINLRAISLKKPHQKEFALYLCKEGAQAIMFGSNDYTITNNNDISVQVVLQKIKKSIIATLKTKTSATSYTLLSSLFFGTKPSREKDMQKTKYYFSVWGLSHYLARSGLHLIIFIALWGFAFCCIPIPYFAKQMILVLLSFVYFCLSWQSISFIRALCMFLLNKTVTLFWLRAHAQNTLLIITLIVLAYNPLYLFFLDFQLSFLLTYGLAFINSRPTKQ